MLAFALEDPDVLYLQALLDGLRGTFGGRHGIEAGYLQAPVLLALNLGAGDDGVYAAGAGCCVHFFHVSLAG